MTKKALWALLAAGSRLAGALPHTANRFVVPMPHPGDHHEFAA
jgi:hypothetical protein